MASFAPVYRPPPQRQSFLAREHKRLRKRKREAHHSDESDGVDDDDAAAPATDLDHSPERGVKDETKDPTPPRGRHPVNRTDPFYVAGLSRDDSLPGGNFPHAPLRKAGPKLVVEQELARLNPPLYVPAATPDAEDGSLRRRHLDNLTAILHKCMLGGDWERASRAWGLILRTEIQGRGVDVRHNGRWLVGGEILMRRNQHVEQQRERAPSDGSDSDKEGQTETGISISDEGFRLAREYYERLTLQYPHMPRQSHTIVNALAIYPALFNVWIFEVHDRALRARKMLQSSSMAVGQETRRVSGQSEGSESTEHQHRLHRIAALELEQGISIAQRMDDIMLNPPYDKSPELLHVRSMVSLWLINLSQTSTRRDDLSTESDTSVSDLNGAPASRRQRNILAQESDVAKRMMKNMLSARLEIPSQLRAFVEDTEQHQEEDG